MKITRKKLLFNGTMYMLVGMFSFVIMSYKNPDPYVGLFLFINMISIGAGAGLIMVSSLIEDGVLDKQGRKPGEKQQ